MSQHQSGILPEHCRFAIYLEVRVQGSLGVIRQGIKTLYQQLTQLQQQYPDAGLGATFAFGHALWRDLAGGKSFAPELKDFLPLANGMAPATQRDMLFHIQSMRHDVNFTLAQQALSLFGDAIQDTEETQGFRWLEERDLSGFVDGTENPAGEKRQQVAIIAHGEDAGGSYVFTQRWQHDLKIWQRLPVEQQEQIIGRTKFSNEELDSATRPATSHISRVDLKEQGQGLKILRQSLPWGSVSGPHGLYFIAYSATLYNIEQQLLSMFGERDGKYDAMLRFTKPVSGAYWFAPSVDVLLAL